jgi:hypothetical protein
VDARHKAGHDARLNGMTPRCGVLIATLFELVMAGLDPAIHVFVARKQVVDARAKRGHDE